MTRKILTINGGGIKGVFPASFLAHIEEKIDGRIGEYFDLVVGTVPIRLGQTLSPGYGRLLMLAGSSRRPARSCR